MYVHFRADCRKKKKFNDKKKQDNNKDDPKGNPSGEVFITFLYALNLYLLPVFQIAGLSILVLHHILLEIINVLLPCKQFQGAIDMST